MPIHRTLELTDITDADFDRVDYAVMNHAYAIQNEFGRLFDERIYENELALRLRADGFTVHTQVPLKVVHGSFTKVYYLDLVVNQMVYELKVAQALTAAHESQCYNYAMLQNIGRIKLLNFGSPTVKGMLLRNALAESDRHSPRLRASGWQILTPNCQRLVDHLKALLADWGTHLDSHLYSEALVHFFGGESECLQRVDVMSGEVKLGTHLIQSHSPGLAFIVTALHENQTAYLKQLQSVFQRIAVQGIQWINLNHSRVEITTLNKSRDDKGMRTEE